MLCGDDLRCKPCIQPGAGTSCAELPDAALAFVACKLQHCLESCPASFTFDRAEADCDAPATAVSEGTCVTVGDDGIDCNPVTGEGCREGDNCVATAAGFVCAPADARRGTCAACGHSAVDACASGHHCVGQCARYCCDSEDCGSEGFCDPTFVAHLYDGDAPAPVGVCVVRP